jgi:Peptidase A4 family
MNISKVVALIAVPVVVAGLALSAGSRSHGPPPPQRPGPHTPAHSGVGIPVPGQGKINGPMSQVEFLNWSGYADHAATAYSKVSASWVEPHGVCTHGNQAQYVSFWVGLDGYSDASVEQDGTLIDCSGKTTEYTAWYEMYPAPTEAFSDRVKPGDHLTSSVIYGGVAFTGGSNYTLVTSDTTRHWTQTVQATNAWAVRSSAEVIVEAPVSAETGDILPLADFSPATFSSAAIDGTMIGRTSPTKIVMAETNRVPKDAVSSIRGGNRFTATWLRSG